MEVEHRPKGDRGIFICTEEGNEMGLASYFMETPSRMVVDHVEVDPQYQGRGIGKVIVMAIVDYAREQDVKIIPWCRFAKRTFERTESIRDVLSPV